MQPPPSPKPPAPAKPAGYGGSPIPAGTSLPKLPTPGGAPDSKEGAKRILIIEDDAVVASLYKTKLQKEGYHIDTAAEGQAGFYGIHELKPDAVLLDLMLPKMDGLSILRKIRAQKQFQKLPVIVFSNAFMSNMLNDAMEAGADQVFNKSDPATPQRIMTAFRDALFPYLKATEAAAAAASAHAPQNQTHEIPYTPAHQYPHHAPAPVEGESEGLTEFIPRPAAIPAHRPAPPSKVLTPPFRTPVEEAPTPAPAPEDNAMQQELLQMFFATAPETMSAVRRSLQAFSKDADAVARLPHLNDLYRKVHSFTGNAGMAGLEAIATFCACLEAFLSELIQKPANINSSTLRTVAAAVDVLAILLEKGTEFQYQATAHATVLVVDDEVLSRRAVTFGLDKAQLKSQSYEHPKDALAVLPNSNYELIVLDVDMPEMDGFELCSQIRKMEAHKTTPVVFITSSTDFKSRTRSILSGGNDFIGKPFMFIELSVKALTFVFRGRLLATKPSATVMVAA